jgi:hypothetical protein
MLETGRFVLVARVDLVDRHLFSFTDEMILRLSPLEVTIAQNSVF